MNKRIISLLLAVVMLLGLLSGCKKESESSAAAQKHAESAALAETAEPTVSATIPADGDPDDVTCKGSYTEEGNADAVVAELSGVSLTNSQLRAFYWAEVAAYQQAGNEVAPDFSRPLDMQTCQIDSSVASWQQYFLRRALNAWHSAQALKMQGEFEGVPTEEAYQPNKKNHAEYLTEKPATRWLYGYNESYIPNELHQAYLDSIPEMLETLAKEKGFADAAAMAKAMGSTKEDMIRAAQLYNHGYMYFTTLSYDFEPEQGTVEQQFAKNQETYQEQGITKDSGKYVDIRHILVVPKEPVPEEETDKKNRGKEETTVATEPRGPIVIAEDGTVTCDEASWEDCRAAADELIAQYQNNMKENSMRALKTTPEALFAELANENSDDTGSRLNGGSYRDLRKGQLIPELDAWCFDEVRQHGDMTTIRTAYGYHILFFCGSRDIWYAEAEADAISGMEAELIVKARENYPASFDYSAISLSPVENVQSMASSSEWLYPDIAHERFPVVPLYLQQDYPTTMYGPFKITSHGCGITTLAMLASYMADDDMTPPRMCVAYEDYVYKTGTDGMLFVNAPAEMGFYLKARIHDWRDARAAMEEGYIAVVVQHKGFWTSGGHYLVLEKLTEDGRVQVRDSNIYNYGRLHDHRIDSFEWSTITPKGMCYWIFEDKVTAIPGCVRCGDPQGAAESLLTEDYYCEKCNPAMIRRDTYLEAVGS